MVSLVLTCVIAACGGAQTDAKEPQTAKEKQLREAKASGDIDQPTNKWAGWRYKGARKECFFVLGRRCFKTEKAACAAARCKAGLKCTSTGGGPAQISCAKPSA